MVDIDDDGKNVDSEELEKFLMEVIDELKERHDNSNYGSLEEKTKVLVSICAKLWKEKEGWKQMYYDLYKRYDKHLDKEIETLTKMLPRNLR